MSRREDTIVSSLPEFDPLKEDKSTSEAAPRARHKAARRVVNALNEEFPPLSTQWGNADQPRGRRRPPSNRLDAPPQMPDHIDTIPAAPMHVPPGTPVSAPPRPPRQPAPQPPQQPPPYQQAPQPPQQAPQPPPSPAGKQGAGIMPIPEPCFEPSVIQEMPQRPASRPLPEPSFAEQTAAPEVRAGGQGRVVVMFSCRGGAGATTLAVNTASALVRVGKSVCVLDLDMQLGDVFMALDLQPTTSIAALAREASTIDASALRRRLARHNSGIFALSQTGNIDDIDDQLVERLPALLSALSDHFDYVIVDGVRDFGDTSLSVLDMADDIAMVLTQDVASVRRAARAIALFRRLGYGDAKLKLVLNRATRRTKVDEGEVQRALGLQIAARVRNDFKRMHAALNEGALICDVAPTCGVAKDYIGLARVLAGPDARVAALTQTQPVEKSSKLGFLRRKGGK